VAVLTPDFIGIDSLAVRSCLPVRSYLKGLLRGLLVRFLGSALIVADLPSMLHLGT